MSLLQTVNVYIRVNRKRKRKSQSGSPRQGGKNPRQTVVPSAERGKNRAIAFVDYEHWYYSLENEYRIRPNIEEWLGDIRKRAEIEDVIFFGDFSEPKMKEELSRIRCFSNNIIETESSAVHRKKDFSDFIILDKIYQSVMSHPDVTTYILFTGDGHFTSAASFLKNQCKKTVGLYGVKNCMSTQLRTVASWWVELPSEANQFKEYNRMILDNIKYLENKKGYTKPTFMKTVSVVSEKFGVSPELIRSALSQLIDQGYIYQQEVRGHTFNSKIKALIADWTKIQEDGIWAEGIGIQTQINQ